MRKNIISIIIIAVLMNMAGQVLAYGDILNHWSRNTIEILSGKGVINGYPDGTFKPDGNINADEFIKMVVTLKGYKLSNGTDYWADPFISKAKELGLVQDGEFSTYERPITRQEMARIIVRGLKESYPTYFRDYRYNLKDYSSIPSSFADFILKAYSKGIITGYEDGTFKGSNNATRAEAATIIIRMADESKRILPGVPATPSPTPVPTPEPKPTPTPTPKPTPAINYFRITAEEVASYPLIAELIKLPNAVSVANRGQSPGEDIEVIYGEKNPKNYNKVDPTMSIEVYAGNDEKKPGNIFVGKWYVYNDLYIANMKKALDLTFPDNAELQEQIYNEMIATHDNQQVRMFDLNSEYEMFVMPTLGPDKWEPNETFNIFFEVIRKH